MHTHKTTEEAKLCAVAFGECWNNPPRTEKTKNKVSNHPNGVQFDENRLNPRKQ